MTNPLRHQTNPIAYSGKPANSSRLSLWPLSMPLCVLLLTLLCVSNVQAANHYTESVKVKSNLPGGFFIDDGYSATFGFQCVISGFTPQSPAAQIAPGVSDPGHSTNIGAVSTVPACWMDCSSGQCGAVWTWNFPSLQDLGVWSFTCGGLQVDPVNCTGTCTPQCSSSAIITEAIPYTIDITVWNNPPTASISHNPTPAWNQTVTLDANSSDPDGGSVSHTWSITTRPSGSTTNLSSTSNETPTLNFNSDDDIGNWAFTLHVDDNEGERKTFTHSFTVPNVPPNISISGATDIDALDNISIAVTPTNDVDGGTLSIVWDLQQSPPGAAFGPQSDFCGTHPGLCSAGNSAITIATTDSDIGTWIFQATATDNEGDDDTAQKTIEVHNIPPEIDFDGTASIDVGDTIHIETTITDDEDGGQLDFLWEIMQAPTASSIPLGIYHSGLGSAGSSIDIPTGYLEAGTWIFRLTATDNDNQPDSEVYDEYTVLVDGPVEAVITGSSPVGNLSLPSPLLDGGDSEDSDSPCDPPSYCHHTFDGRPVTLENGQNLHYTWYLADVPLELFIEYPLGRVDEVFGVSATGPTLNLSAGDLEEGDWVFELQVDDEEGNSDTTSFLVTVINETGPPFAFITPTQRFTVDIANVLHQDIVIDSAGSLDIDNLISGDPMPGITDYTWSYVSGPPGCMTAPTPPSGAGATSFTLYHNGDFVPPECQGYWKIGLTVTDDDSTPKTATAETFVIIGNCDTILCIDYPTTAIPALVDFADDTDILIYYRLDSAAYDDLLFSAGVFTRLSIYHESDLTTPVYTDFDPNVLATNKGGNLVFHWNGYSDLGTRPIEGAYTVGIDLFDSSFTLGTINAAEIDAILIAVAEPSIDPGSETLLRYEDIVNGTDTLDINYIVTGGGSFDQVVWHVYDSSNTEIATGNAPAVSPGSFGWDGLSTGVAVSPGEYEIELETLRTGSSMGTSARHAFKVYSLDLDVDTNRDATIDDADETGEDAWTKTLGAIFGTNYDRDGGRSSGGLPIPDTIHINDSGTPGNEDLTIDNANDEQDITPLLIKGIGVDLPPGHSVFLKAAELEDVQSIHVFKQIAAGETAIWGALGSRIGGPAVPLEIDITNWVNPSSPGFVGSGPSGDATFGLEGLFFRSLGVTPVNPFNGEIELTLELRNGAVVVASDTVKMKVAPWMMLPHTQASQQVWTIDHTWNAPLRLTASNDPGYFGLDDSTQLHTESSAALAGSQWFQDHFEMGYYQRPGGPGVNAILRLPYGAPQPAWPMHKWLKGNTALPAHDIGAFQLAASLGAGAGDFGGNVELMPPTPSHPLGRIIIGSTRSDDLWEFLNSQEVQAPVEIPTAWLSVSHVDEVIGFKGTGTDVVISDPVGAYALMNAIPAADRGRHVFFATGAIPETGTATAPAGSTTRIETGVDHSGTSWEYIRIYDDAGSGAAGQVAHIATRGVGFLEVDKVWNIPQKIIPGGGAADFLSNYIGSEAPHKGSWYVNPSTGDNYVLVEGTRFWHQNGNPGGHGTPAIVTVAEVLADADLQALNTTDIQGKITSIKSTLNTAHGSPLTYIPVPVIYFGNRTGFDTNRESVAMTPGLSNFQLVNGTLYFPRQFGPRNPVTGVDLFEAAVLSGVPGAKFVDDWNLYHRLEGEVHCGSNVLRVPYALDWWSNQP